MIGYTDHPLIGTVDRLNGYYYHISCPDAPDRFKHMVLNTTEIGPAKVGDKVRLTYVNGSTYGRWMVAEVLA